MRGLWIGDRLGAMQRASIQSFLDAGHSYELFTYGPISGVPAGVRLVDGNEVTSAARIWRYTEFDSPAGFSNQFRYRLLRERGGTWADLDVICLRPLPDADYLLPSQRHESEWAATCLLRAPRRSPLLELACSAAEAVDPATAVWGQTGPRLMTRLVTDLQLEALPIEAVCPIDFPDWAMSVSDRASDRAEVERRTASSFAVHLWHEMWRRAGADVENPGPAGCFYARVLERFDPVRRGVAVG